MGHLSCETGMVSGVIDKETFEREIALCKQLKDKNGHGCCWGECNNCGVLPLLVKFHEGRLIEDKTELLNLREELLG